MILLKASSYLINKKIDEEMIAECIYIAKTEISPISDTRGSLEYKILLLSQLLKAHFSNLL
jgi:xanthine dehydrogenase small subunit